MSCKKAFQRYKNSNRYSEKVSVLMFLSAVLLTACGQGQDIGRVISGIDGQEAETNGASLYRKDESSEAAQGDIARISDTDETEDNLTDTAQSDTAGTSKEDKEAHTAGGTESNGTAELDELQRRFGRNCISRQTFEVELSEYDGKVWFVPFAPSKSEDFHIQIMKDDEELYELSAYVPEELAGENFVSLDAAAFFDVNYDGDTDIVLIETYGDTSFAVVYYGEVDTLYDESSFALFHVKEQLSDNLTSNVEELTISAIRDFLGDGKRNGEFADYREAYLAVAKLKQMESDSAVKYELIYFDDDDMPELVADYSGYNVSLYTYHDGKIYTIMEEWGYGAGGNHGYEYCPRKNSVRNYNTDYAGLILYTTYWTVNAQYMMDTVVSIKLVNFDDANGNGIPDGDEAETAGYYGALYIDGVEITTEESMSYSMGEYEYMGSGVNSMSLEELTAVLN